TCINPMTDPLHCGGCMTMCASGQACVAGHCKCTTTSCSGCCAGDDCKPGSQMDSCGAGGGMCQTCVSACVNGGCSGCSAGMTETLPCGNCGMKVRACDGSGVWGTFGACNGQGACRPSDTRQSSCGNCGTETDTCNTACQWTMGACNGTGVCHPGDTQHVSCGPTGNGTEVDT